MSKPLSARLRLMLYEDIALEVEAMENEFTRLTREVEALRELLQSCKEGRSAWSAECERLRDTVVSYLDEIDRLNKVGGSDVDPECDSCAMLRELLRPWADSLPPNGDLYWHHVELARAYFARAGQAADTQGESK